MALNRVLKYSSHQCITFLKKYWFVFVIAACVLTYFQYQPVVGIGGGAALQRRMDNLKGNKNQQYIRDFHPFINNSLRISDQFEDIENLSQDDPRLITFIRNNVLKPPSDQKYNLTHPFKRDFSQYEQGLYLIDFFRNKKNGIFIEAGAWDGEQFSNTLILERELGWTGLLVEPNPERYPQLLAKHRKAYSAYCCISLSERTKEITLRMKGLTSHIVDDNDNQKSESVKVKCYPFFSLLAAMNITSLDFLSLDVESVEVKTRLNGLAMLSIHRSEVISANEVLDELSKFKKKLNMLLL